MSNKEFSDKSICAAQFPTSTHSYQISAAARANLGNTIVHTPIEELSEDATMIEDALTDEEESLNTPSYQPIELSTEDEGDIENGGCIGQLERGWNQLFREMY